MSSTKRFGLGFALLVLLHQGVYSHYDYASALTKSILYFEGQRSGKLPHNQRVAWRGDSGLNDGQDNKIDLTGGYYDAGDNVKFGFPMAYTVTMLAWGVVEFEDKLAAKNELTNVLDAIKWGTDYIIKAHPEPDKLFAQVGDAVEDHNCWQRPEDMTTPRTSYHINAECPGSDLASESAAALAAASIAFKKSNPGYAALLIKHANELFNFAKNHRGRYSDSIPSVQKFYCSSDEQDEMLWAAAWIYRATGDQTMLHYIDDYYGTGGPRTMFSWDDKYVGVQVLVAKLYLENKIDQSKQKWIDYRTFAEQFICNCMQKGNKNVERSAGGLNWWQSWNNIQYTTSAAFVATVYAKYLREHSSTIGCPGGTVGSQDLLNFAKSQVDYILGANPKGMSFMVGYGTNCPKKIHHRGASIVSIKTNPAPVTCKGGYIDWYNKDAPDPNALEGAVVGGPYKTDEYSDARDSYSQSEPATVNTAPLVGVLAELASCFQTA